MKRTVLMSALVIALCAILASLGEDDAQPVAVQIEIASESSHIASVGGSGSLEAYRTRRLGIAGYAVADEIYLNVGDAVREGQVIMTFREASNAAISAEPDRLLANADIAAALTGDVAEAVGSILAETVAVRELVSPFDGVVTAISLEEGEQASPLAAVAEVSDLSRIRARIRLSEQDAAEVTVGMPATVESGGASYDAVVVEVAPTVRTSVSLSGASECYREVLLELYAPEDATAGSSATATICTERRTGVVTLPFTAIDQDSLGREFVFLCENGRARLCYIATGRELGNSVEVFGISAGDAVIVSADASLEHGAAVEAE